MPLRSLWTFSRVRVGCLGVFDVPGDVAAALWGWANIALRANAAYQSGGWHLSRQPPFGGNSTGDAQRQSTLNLSTNAVIVPFALNVM
jgi:hypothetical protein